MRSLLLLIIGLVSLSVGARPLAEYEKVRTLVMNGNATFFTAEAKRKILQNLPHGVRAIVYGSTPQALTQIKKRFAAEARRSPELRFALWPGSGWAFWSRDSLPYPIVSDGTDALVDARYHIGYEPDASVARDLGLPLRHHEYFFEGGNLVADRRGHCFVVHGSSDVIPDAVFFKDYGCSTLTRLEKLGGIGHADERIKFLSDRDVLTDTPEYLPTLKKFGYQVTLLPRGPGYAASYVNAILVNGTVFVPEFARHQSDARALEIYRSFGLRVIALDARLVARFGFGGFHCMTMTYR